MVPITLPMNVFDRFRYGLAFLLLVFLAGMLPAWTIYHNSVQTNNFAAVLQFLCFMLTFRESLPTAYKCCSLPDNFYLFVFIVTIVIIISASFFIDGGYDRFFFYIGSVLFFFSLVHFFRKMEHLFYILLWVKILSVLVACVLFFLFIMVSSDEIYSFVAIDPPIYRNIRHFNYDLMLAIGCLYLLLIRGRIGLLFFGLLFLCLSVASIWSGGRGQLLALFALFVLLFGSGFYRHAAFGTILIIFSAFLVYMSGETALIHGSLDRTIQSSSLDAVSSGRWDIWKTTWNAALEGGWLGYGADAFRYYDFEQSFVIQPHNSILQFFIEYGFLGLAASVFFFWWASFTCLKQVFSRSNNRLERGLASFVITMFGYSLVDGIFYHAIPFSFMIILGAFLFLKVGLRDSSVRSL